MRRPQWAVIVYTTENFGGDAGSHWTIARQFTFTDEALADAKITELRGLIEARYRNAVVGGPYTKVDKVEIEYDDGV